MRDLQSQVESSLVFIDVALLIVIAATLWIRWASARGPGFADLVLGFVAACSVVSMVLLVTQPWGRDGECGSSALYLVTADIDWAPPGPPAGCGVASAQHQVDAGFHVLVWSLAVAFLLAVVASAVSAVRTTRA